MERKKEKVLVDNALELATEYDCGNEYHPIDELIKFLVESKQRGAQFIEFSGSCEYDNHNNLESVDIHPILIILESDEDLEARKEGERIRLEQKRARIELNEKEVLRQLKEKYPNS